MKFTVVGGMHLSNFEGSVESMTKCCNGSGVGTCSAFAFCCFSSALLLTCAGDWSCEDFPHASSTLALLKYYAESGILGANVNINELMPVHCSVLLCCVV